MILRREVLAAEARRLIDMHDDWDSSHAIVTLHPDEDGGLRPGTWKPEHPIPPGYNGAALCGCGSAISQLAETRRYLRSADHEPPF
jgi:hypothetical protein